MNGIAEKRGDLDNAHPQVMALSLKVASAAVLAAEKGIQQQGFYLAVLTQAYFLSQTLSAEECCDRAKSKLAEFEGSGADLIALAVITYGLDLEEVIPKNLVENSIQPVSASGTHIAEGGGNSPEGGGEGSGAPTVNEGGNAQPAGPRPIESLVFEAAPKRKHSWATWTSSDYERELPQTGGGHSESHLCIDAVLATLSEPWRQCLNPFLEALPMADQARFKDALRTKLVSQLLLKRRELCPGNISKMMVAFSVQQLLDDPSSWTTTGVTILEQWSSVAGHNARNNRKGRVSADNHFAKHKARQPPRN
jgi:hypothetical protein